MNGDNTRYFSSSLLKKAHTCLTSPRSEPAKEIGAKVLLTGLCLSFLHFVVRQSDMTLWCRFADKSAAISTNCDNPLSGSHDRCGNAEAKALNDGVVDVFGHRTFAAGPGVRLERGAAPTTAAGSRLPLGALPRRQYRPHFAAMLRSQNVAGGADNPRLDLCVREHIGPVEHAVKTE